MIDSKKLRLPLILCLVVNFNACIQKEIPEPSALFPSSVTIEGDKFIDDLGRQVILNGINVVNKSKEDNYLFEGGPEFYSDLKKWGFNCIRFIIIWDGLEPEPGVYNEDYLQEIDQRIQWAGENGIHVVLDMHQDLFSVKYSDGAPEWATLDEGKPHVTGAVWSDAYMLSEAVQTSFDNFWANKPAADGIGIQDHYINLWKYVASRYRNNPTVIGYDIMNEPFPGSSALQGVSQFLQAYAELVYQMTGKVLSEEEVANAWSKENRTVALGHLSSKENYAKLVDAVQEYNQEFDQTQLMPMYQGVSSAIREVDTNKIIFLEHSYYSNIGVSSGIDRTKLLDGRPDPLVAYSPHAYDLVTDTKEAASSESERVGLIFERINGKAKELGMPVWLGEWGAYYRNDADIVPVAQYAVSLIEHHLFGHAYWSYDPGLEELAYFKEALLRPYPAYINGELIDYQSDFESGTFTLQWIEGNSEVSTLIYIPWLSRLDQDVAESQSREIIPIEGSDAGWVVVPAVKSGERSISLMFS